MSGLSLLIISIAIATICLVGMYKLLMPDKKCEYFFYVGFVGIVLLTIFLVIVGL